MCRILPELFTSCLGSKCRETPLPIYIRISVHAKTRSRDLVETLHNLGIGVLAISTDLGNEVCRRYIDEGAVCPTATVDSIDHNPTSTTAHDSFHGTGISLFQQQLLLIYQMQWPSQSQCVSYQRLIQRLHQLLLQPSILTFQRPPSTFHLKEATLHVITKMRSSGLSIPATSYAIRRA